MLMKRLLVFVEKWGLLLLVLCTGLAIGLSVAEEMEPKSGEYAVSLWTAMLNTATSTSESAQGWSKRMHLMVNVTLAWAAIRVYMATVGLKWDNFAARYLARSHVIIVAGKADSNPTDQAARSPRDVLAQQVDKGALAIDLALSMVATQQVVLSLKSVDEGKRIQLWEAGVTVLTQDMAMADVLQATGAKRASMLIAMRDHYGDNITLTRAAMAPRLNNPDLECKCLIEPLSVKRNFRLEDYFETESLSRIRVFNESELIARRVLQTYPPDLPVAASDVEGVHVLLVGLGSVGQSVLLQLARIGHYRSSKNPKATVIDRNAKLQWLQLLEAYPQLESLLTVEPQERAIEEVNADDLDRWLCDERPVTIAYVCTRVEIANLRVARLLLAQMQMRASEGHARVADVVALDPPGGCVLSDYAQYGQHEGYFHLFSQAGVNSDQRAKKGEGAGSLISDINDSRARQFHEGYCTKDRLECANNPGQKPKPFNQPWADLPETAREANRITADHFEVKMRAVGCCIVARSEGSEPTILSPDELEMLARMEHKRWAADRSLDGWKYDTVRCNKRKLHPNLVPYDELTEPIKQLDRDAVLQMVEILGTEGLVITRSALKRPS